MTTDPNKQLIFILDDDESATELLEEYINKKLSDIDVYAFNTCYDMIHHPLIKDCSLFIIDIELDADAKGNEVADELFKNKFNKPYLFMSGKAYDFECFQQYDYTYDFIKKPLDLNKLMNRITVLLKVSDTYRLHEMEEKKLKFSLKEVFDYTNIYMIIL